MITKLHMVILIQADLPAAVAFYKKLGLHPEFYITSKWAEFKLGETKLGLCPLPHTEGTVSSTRTGLVFEVPDLAAFMDEVSGECEFLGQPIEKPHGIMLSIKDPGGNIIDIYQPTPEKLKEYLAQKAQEEANQGCCGSRAQSSCDGEKRAKETCCGKKC